MKFKKLFLSALRASVYALVVSISVDLIYGFFTDPFYLKHFILIFFASFLIFLFLEPARKFFWVFILIEIGAVVISACLMVVFYLSSPYSVSDSGKAELYGNRNIMILVPHQDDEILVAGGIIEEYIKYGSNVSIVFSTNGASSDNSICRLKEALAVAEEMQIPEENIFFLGYGDQCSFENIHIYNLPDDVPTTSSSGQASTFGLDSHPAFNQGKAYTKANMRADIKAIFLQQRPDIIYCVAVEPHPDHSALALLADEVMAEILKDGFDYNPILMMSSCYSTAYYSNEDFSAVNLLSTQNPVNNVNFADVYDWEQRTRLPVHSSNLSRSVYGCGTYQQLLLHESQILHLSAECGINSDKVFWLRDSSSLCYNAKIHVSSGHGEYLNDFKLFDNSNLFGDFRSLAHNTWVPDNSDTKKTALVELEEPSFLQRICLYDDPSIQNNVLNALITFDDGTCIETGPLNKNGFSSFEVNKENVSSFSIKLLNTEGTAAGLTEIEAYSSQANYGFNFIKLQNLQGDFVYDYYIDRSGSEQFTIYSSGVSGDLIVSSNSPKCPIKYEDELVSVTCPKGKQCTITISTIDGECSDTVTISNPGFFMRKLGPWLEFRLRQFSKLNFSLTNTYQYASNPENIIKVLKGEY